MFLYVSRQSRPSEGSRQDLMLGKWAYKSVSYLMLILFVKYAEVF